MAKGRGCGSLRGSGSGLLLSVVRNSAYYIAQPGRHTYSRAGLAIFELKKQRHREPTLVARGASEGSHVTFPGWLSMGVQWELGSPEFSGNTFLIN